MSLKAYKLDKAFTEGVDIRLDEAPEVVFKVRLPSQYNRGYTQALYGSLEWSTDSTGNFKTGGDLMKTRWAQEDAFMSNCLLSMDGEPIPDNFADEYPAAVQELMEKATDLVSDIEERVSSSAKKSSTTSTGKDAGRAKSDSISLSKSVAG